MGRSVCWVPPLWSSLPLSLGSPGPLLPSKRRWISSYLGYFNAAAAYNSGTGPELRHTIGTRFFGNIDIPGGLLDWNYEAMLQFGSFDSQRGKGSILAWRVGTETGYTLEPFFFSPRFSLRANVISGDHNANDANLQTFNPLFPKGNILANLPPWGLTISSMCWALSDST